MRQICALTTLLAIAAFSSAAAQSGPVPDVTVNPSAFGAQVLIDPGTGRTRVVPPLLMPGRQTAPIILHLPRHRRAAEPPAATPPAAEPQEAPPAAVVSTPPREPRRQRVARTPPPTPPAPPAPAPTRAAESAPAPTLSDLDSIVAETPAPAPKPVAPPPPARTASIVPPKPAPVEAPPPPPSERQVRSASIEPRQAGPRPRDVIVFAAGASDPSATAVASVRALANSLGSALLDGGARVEIKAYAGERGEKSSDTRRLSLKRALVIRQLLIDDGVPSERIDVYALGGAEDAGPLDRVDVFLKS